MWLKKSFIDEDVDNKYRNIVEQAGGKYAGTLTASGETTCGLLTQKQ